MLGELLPPAVSVVEVFDDPPGVGLYPEEEAFVAWAVQARRREFTTGRYCARAALCRLGLAPSAIARGARGAPDWPDGVVGSITHCAGYRAAAVARATDLVTIGIDAEPNEPLPSGVLELVSLPRERARLAVIARATPGTAWDRLLFSAKESIYKAWLRSPAPSSTSTARTSPSTTRRAPSSPTSSRPAATSPPESRGQLHGRFAVRRGLVVTAIAR